MKKIIILLSLLLTSLTAVCADDYEFSISAIRDDIDSGEDAQFLVIITNNENSIKTFRLSSPELRWIVPTEDVKAYPETDTSYKLTISPTKHVDPGKMHGIELKIEDTETGITEYSSIVQVYVRSNLKAVSEYRPSVRMTADVPSSIDPRDSVKIKVKLENQNLLNLSNIVLKVSSEIEEFNAEKITSLIPLGKKLVEFDYELDPLQESGSYKITFELLQDDEAIESVEKTATISMITPELGEDEGERGIFFKTATTKTYTSSSNVETTETIKIPTNMVKRWFTSTDPASDVVVEEDGRYRNIEITLQPGESKTITVTTNYRIIVYFLILVLAMVYLNQRYKSPINIKKGVSDVGVKEGGISEMKVTLELTNTAKKPVKNITVTDYIPNIAELEKKFSEGTLKPSKVFKHKTKGTVMKWDIEELSPGEDRMISYNIRSKLSIVGNFSMPRAKTVSKKKKREIVAYSNQVGVSS